jgi:tetratricopeptide (TPR) repeat protein
MCIYGPPGCGKSILAASIVDHIRNNKVPALFFAFSSMHVSQQKSGLIRSLLWQLVEIAPEEQNIRILHNLMLRGQPTISDLWMAFNTMAKTVSEPVYCIVDGVDKSTDATRLLQRILGFLGGCSNYRFILLGRQHAFQGINSNRYKMSIHPTLTKGDIDRVITTGIDQSAILRLPKLRKKVFRSLRDKSDGNFLWVQLMLGHLSKSLGLADALKRLNNLPRDLQAAYEDLLLDLFGKLEPDELELARKVFAFIIVSQRPLSLNEFQHLLSADAMSTCTCDTHSVEDHLIPELNRRIPGICGDLICVKNGCLQLIHCSVMEFLVRPESQWSRHRRSRKIMVFRVHLEDAHRWLGTACIEYLEKCDYGFPFHDWDDSPKRGQHYPFLRYSSVYSITHIHQSGLPSDSILTKIDRFLNSDHWIAWLELFSMNIIDDEFLHSQGDEIKRFASWLGERPEKLLRRASASLQASLERRAHEYGQEDSRTEQVRLLLGFLEGYAASTSPEATDSYAVQSTGQSTDVLPILQLVRHDGPMPLHLQVNLLLRMQTQLQKVRRLSGPIQVLFRIILQKASAMPVYILFLVGDFYNRVGKFEQALEIYFAALGKVKKKEGRVKFLALRLIGITYSNLSQYDRALEQFQYALHGQEKVLGSENEETLHTLHWIGVIYETLDRHEDALEYFTKALTGYEKVLGPEHRDTLNTFHSLGIVYNSLRRHKDALEYYTKALIGREKVLGPEHKDTLKTLHAIGIVYDYLDRHEDALECFTKALTGYEKVLGPEHTDTLNAFHSIGIVYEHLDRHKDALEYYTKALIGREKVLGPEHTDTLNTFHAIGIVYEHLNRHEDSLDIDNYGRRLSQEMAVLRRISF